MNAYLVRLKTTHELMGIYVCERQQLWDLIDDHGDPSECEAAPIGIGGLCWPYPGAQTVPIPKTADSDPNGPEPLKFIGVEITSDWWDFINGWNQLIWVEVRKHEPAQNT